jgi:lipid A 3-O-deacylase
MTSVRARTPRAHIRRRRSQRQCRARCAALLAVLALSASAGTAAAGERGTFTFVLENDVFYDTDRHYTNGVRIGWAGTKAGAPRWATWIADRLPVFPTGGPVQTLYTLGQNMYTPNDITVESPPLDVRPYAGWLYGSVGLVAERGKQLDQLEISLGIVGPSSFAEDTQKFVHEAIESQDPKGWHTQLGNEPALLLSYQHSWREAIDRPLGVLDLDLTPTAGFSLGNVFTHASAGATLRLGNDPPLDYGPPRLQPSLPGSGFFTPPGRFVWYLFAGIEARAVARNIFLDGNTFQDSRSVNSRPLVGDAQAGFVTAWRQVRLSYTHVFRTREFKGQSERDDFGAFSLSVRF